MTAILQFNGETIIEVPNERIRFDPRIGRFITTNNSFYLKEDEKVFVFTEKKLDEYAQYYIDKIVDSYEKTNKTMQINIETLKKVIEFTKELEKENKALKKLNKELSETIIHLKNVEDKE